MHTELNPDDWPTWYEAAEAIYTQHWPQIKYRPMNYLHVDALYQQFLAAETPRRALERLGLVKRQPEPPPPWFSGTLRTVVEAIVVCTFFGLLIILLTVVTGR